MFLQQNNDSTAKARNPMQSGKKLRADKLEIEVQCYSARLADAEYYGVRVNGLKKYYNLLIETKEMLARARQRADHVLELEAGIIACKHSINDVVFCVSIILL